MRITTLLRKLLGLKNTIVADVGFDAGTLVVDVKPSRWRARCSGCDRICGTYDHRAGRQWRHLDIWGLRTCLRYDLRRVSCSECGVRVEAVPWAQHGSMFTTVFENEVGYLAQRTDKTTVCRVMGIAWRTVGEIAQRVVDRHVDQDERLNGLEHIGIDELSYRRHHEYVTVVVDLVFGRVVWARRGKNADTLRAFFNELGADRAASIKTVCIDMSAAYQKAVAECVPGAEVVFDRFHVQRLAHNALDEVRRSEVRQAPPDDRRRLKHTRFALLKNPWNLTVAQTDKLSTLSRTNKRLYRAYLLKESLAAVLDRRQVNVARGKLTEWLQWASRSRLAPFVRLARTIRGHLEGILAYVRTGLSNGPVEGLNGKARVLTRRAFGFHSAESLIALLFLCCSGLYLDPIRIARAKSDPLTH